MSTKSLKVWPVLAGVTGSFGLLLFYFLLAGLTSRSWPHAFQLIRDDAPYVAAIAIGFGMQIALLIYLRRVIRLQRSGGNLVATAGTGASSASMIACCLHHTSDILPLVGMSGAAIFLSQYKYQVMGVGIAANVIGIILMVRTIYRHGAVACQH
ncbi:MAG: hypothetical protein ACYCX4_07790 [Bacillota bacterium]